jgi:hypothetical protein
MKYIHENFFGKSSSKSSYFKWHFVFFLCPQGVEDSLEFLTELCGFAAGAQMRKIPLAET